MCLLCDIYYQKKKQEFEEKEKQIRRIFRWLKNTQFFRLQTYSENESLYVAERFILAATEISKVDWDEKVTHFGKQFKINLEV